MRDVGSDIQDPRKILGTFLKNLLRLYSKKLVWGWL